MSGPSNPSDNNNDHAANDNNGLPRHGPVRADLGKERLRPPLPKRFYKSAAFGVGENGFAVTLDGRPVKTPAKAPLLVPTRALAEAIAAEWAAQGQHIDPATMPLTRLANTALDAVADNLAAVAADIVAFSGNDLLCYRADGPAELIAQQAAAWDGILAWAEQSFGARFTVITGILHIDQPRETSEAVARALSGLDAWEIAPIHVMTTLTGSAVLALAVAREAQTEDAAWTAAHVDEDWQISGWGADEEATARRAQRRSEMAAAARFLALVRTKSA